MFNQVLHPKKPRLVREKNEERERERGPYLAGDAAVTIRAGVAVIAGVVVAVHKDDDGDAGERE